MAMTETKYPLAATFGVPAPAQIALTGYQNRTEHVPDIDPGYVHNPETLRDIANWWESGGTDGILLFGPQGAGKTSSIRQFAAKLNIPVYEKTAYDKMRFGELLLHTSLSKGNSLYYYGQLTKAMGVENEPGIFLLNEGDHASDGVLTGMFEVLEGNPLDIVGMDVVKPKPRFRVAMCTNASPLLGDNTGLFRGGKRMNAAFLDRFWTVRVAYPSADIERQVLEKKVPGLDERNREKMIECANDVRAAFMGVDTDQDRIEVTISTRSLVRWARIAVMMKDAEKAGISPILYALDRTVLNLASVETREAVQEIVHGHFDIPESQRGRASKKAA